MPSCKTYYLLSNQNGDSGKFNDECHSLQEKFPYSGISGQCKKLADNLVNFCSNDEKNYPLNYNCEFLHHWLFNDIIHNLNITTTGERNGVKSQFYYTWKNIVHKLACENKCEPIWMLFKSLTLEELSFRKDMYEYIYNYENFDKITTSEKICNKLSTYLPTMLEKYANFKSSCQATTKKCLHDAKSLEDYNPEKLCQRFECKQVELCSKYIDVGLENSHLGGNGISAGVESANNKDAEAVTSVEEFETSTIMTTLGPSLLGLFIISFISFKVMRIYLKNYY